MSVIDTIKDVIKDYKYKISTHRYGIFGLCKGAKIQIDEKTTEELFTSIVSLFNNEFGVPVCVHSYYGFIWIKDGKYIACNTIEEIYGCDFLDIFVFDKIPLGKKLSYEKYDLIDGTIIEVFHKLGFNCDKFIHYNLFELFLYIVINEKTQWSLQLKGKKMACYLSEVSPMDDGMKRVTPRYRCKKIVNTNNLEAIKNAMEQSFSDYQKAEKV